MRALPLLTTPDSVCRSENDVTLAGPSLNQRRIYTLLSLHALLSPVISLHPA